MRFVRLPLIFAATVFVTVASEAQPTQPLPAQKIPLAVMVLNGIDDPVVIAELKLKDEQVKALVARRKDLWDEAYTALPSQLAEMAAARNAATDTLLKKTLTGEQYKRAIQLGGQSLFQANFGVDPGTVPTLHLTTVRSATLNTYPELVTAFALTDAQKKQLATPVTKSVGKGGGGFSQPSIRMSQEQTAVAKEFLGPVAKTWQPTTDPRIANRPLAPEGFNLFAAKDVRAELKLSEADAKVLTDLTEKWQQLNRTQFTELSPKEGNERAAELKAASEKALAGLKPEQVLRMKQIAFQRTRGGWGGPADLHIEQLYADARVIKELALTDAQAKKFQAIRDAFEKDAAVVLGSAASVEPAEKKLNELADTRRAKAEAVITADQAAKLKALTGAPFKGRTLPDRMGGPPPQILETIRAVNFGNYTAELSYLAENKSIQEELKLDEKQIKQAATAQAEITNNFPVRLIGGDREVATKVSAEKSQAIKEELDKLLNVDQAKRFRQLMLQSCERQPNIPAGAFSSAIHSAVIYPGVAEAVKLSDDQKKKLIAGTAPDDVLTPVQKTAIQKMLGEPFKGDFALRPVGGPMGSRFPEPSAIVRLFGGPNSNAAAEESLKLSDDQKKALSTARAAYQKAMQEAQPVPPNGLNPAQSAVAQRAAIEAFDKTVMELLTPEQKTRAAQLVVQVNAAMNLTTTLTAPDMVQALGLTKSQTEKLTALDKEATQLQELRMAHIFITPDQKLGPQMRDAADERMMAVLTDAQKKTWKAQTGEPLPGFEKSFPRGFGGFGGFSGPGGFGGGFGGPGGGFGGSFGP